MVKTMVVTMKTIPYKIYDCSRPFCRKANLPVALTYALAAFSMKPFFNMPPKSFEYVLTNEVAVYCSFGDSTV